MAPAELERRLSAILTGDLKGFTRLVAEDELLAVSIVRDFRALVRERVEATQGTLVEASGDGFLAKFNSVKDAARCAVDLNRQLMGSQEDSPRDRRLVAQMGLSVGEVIHYGSGVLGTTVNLAFHLRQFAPPGGVALPASAADQLGAGDFEVVDLGERQITGLAKPVRIQCLRTGVEVETTEADDEPQRRLAAILEADVVGWSRLIATREAETVAAITPCRDAMIARVGARRGRVVDSTGDNLLAEFRSALDAVLCAIEIQREHTARNAELPEDARLEFRVGIHLADVRIEGERIYGSGVNIAARLEALAAPGGVCISASVHEQVRYHLDLEFEDLGDQELKNIPHPVRAFGFGGGRRKAAPPPTLYARLKRRFSHD